MRRFEHGDLLLDPAIVVPRTGSRAELRIAQNSGCAPRLAVLELNSSCHSSARRFGMPRYEFLCLNGKKLFCKTLFLVDYEDGEVCCPHCGQQGS